MIKHRAKSIETEEWLYGTIVCDLYGFPHAIIEHGGTELIPIDGETFGRLVGEKVMDYNGNILWEGDIIDGTSGRKDPTQHEIYYCEETCRFKARMITFRKNPPTFDLSQEWIDVIRKRVIGNIHDDFYLLVEPANYLVKTSIENEGLPIRYKEGIVSSPIEPKVGDKSVRKLGRAKITETVLEVTKVKL